jgi:hypothetical protein
MQGCIEHPARLERIKKLWELRYVSGHGIIARPRENPASSSGMLKRFSGHSRDPQPMAVEGPSNVCFKCVIDVVVRGRHRLRENSSDTNRNKTPMPAELAELLPNQYPRGAESVCLCKGCCPLRSVSDASVIPAQKNIAGGAGISIHAVVRIQSTIACGGNPASSARATKSLLAALTAVFSTSPF